MSGGRGPKYFWKECPKTHPFSDDFLSGGNLELEPQKGVSIVRDQTLVFLLGIVLLAGCHASTSKTESGLPLSPPPQNAGSRAETSTNFAISGPFVHQNLAIFLIHGTGPLAGKEFLSLQEAMEQGKVIVHETENVNELAIENLSGDEIFVQAGDIVKGGKQDRTFANDVVLGPHSGRVPIASFCVEQGRWSGRPGEVLSAFSISDNQLSNKSLKLAARHANDQGQVWQEVRSMQIQLSRVTAAEFGTTSSLQLSLENDQVQEARDEYVEALRGSIQGEKDVIGFAFAINGELNSADLYASPSLFHKVYLKLLKASAIEAVASTKDSAPVQAPKAEAVRSWLAEAKEGQASQKPLSAGLHLVTRESETDLLFETRDGAEWLHRSYIRK